MFYEQLTSILNAKSTPTRALKGAVKEDFVVLTFRWIISTIFHLTCQSFRENLCNSAWLSRVRMCEVLCLCREEGQIYILENILLYISCIYQQPRHKFKCNALDKLEENVNEMSTLYYTNLVYQLKK